MFKILNSIFNKNKSLNNKYDICFICGIKDYKYRMNEFIKDNKIIAYSCLKENCYKETKNHFKL